MNFNLINGNIITLDQSNPIANSVTIENDKISSTENTNSSVSWTDMNSINQKKSETNIQNGNLVANS